MCSSDLGAVRVKLGFEYFVIACESCIAFGFVVVDKTKSDACGLNGSCFVTNRFVCFDIEKEFEEEILFDLATFVRRDMFFDEVISLKEFEKCKSCGAEFGGNTAASPQTSSYACGACCGFFMVITITPIVYGNASVAFKYCG